MRFSHWGSFTVMAHFSERWWLFFVREGGEGYKFFLWIFANMVCVFLQSSGNIVIKFFEYFLNFIKRFICKKIIYNLGNWSICAKYIVVRSPSKFKLPICRRYCVTFPHINKMTFTIYLYRCFTLDIFVIICCCSICRPEISYTPIAISIIMRVPCLRSTC